MNEKMEKIKEAVFSCQKCELYKTKKKYVFGDGNAKAKVIFIGEAPGANEDEQGIPFVGKAGKIFDELLRSIDVQRESIYIANILKCRPPQNRNPQLNEIEACTPYLKAQIDLINPVVICPMGNFAVKFILHDLYHVVDKVDGISKIHGQMYSFNNIWGKLYLIPLYHPAVATYNAEMKDILIKDIQRLKNVDKWKR